MIRVSQFVPCKWGKNPHSQTIWPTIVRKGLHVATIPQRLETSDGDFLDLAWSAIPTGQDGGPILVLFHGLEGSVDSHYIKGIFQLVRKLGWVAVLMHFRGCSGVPNRRVRSYHSGETGDADFLIRYLKRRFPVAPLFGIGFSLGANMLLKYLGEQQDKTPLNAAIAVSVPFQLNDCVTRLETGFSRVYQRYLLSCLKTSLKQKLVQVDCSSQLSLTPRNIDKLKSLREFDDVITAPIHGFSDADDYYQQCSSKQYLQRIAIRTLILQALDDPFVPQTSLPTAEDLPEHVTLEISTQGGHVGFVRQSTPDKSRFWLEERIPMFIEDRLKHRLD